MKQEFFEAMYKSLKKNFPRFCGCGTIHLNEQDYNKRTKINQGHMDGTQVGLGRMFLRTCQEKDCRTTIPMTLDEKEFDEDDALRLSTYIGNRATRESKKPSQIADEVRTEYNQWLENPEFAFLRLVLGLDISSKTADMLKKITLTKARFMNTADYAAQRGYKTPAARDLYLLDRNQDRIQVVLIEADSRKIDDQSKLITAIRNYDSAQGKHTPVLAIGAPEELKRGYYNFNINGTIPANSEPAEVKRTLENYLNAVAPIPKK